MATTVNPNGEVNFVCRSDAPARQVFLAGSCNDWAPGARRLLKTRDGAFRGRNPKLCPDTRQPCLASRLGGLPVKPEGRAG